MAMSFQDKKNPNPFFKKTRFGLYGFGGAYRIRTGDLNDGCVIIALCSLRASARDHSDSQALGLNEQRYRSTCEQDKLGDDG